jgi:stress response protein YsnF
VAGRSRYDHETIPVVEERAVIRKRRRITGAVQVRTEVREHDAIVEEPIETEQVSVERVPIDEWVEAAVPVRQEGDTTIISVHEEVIVIEKRLKLVEEIHITRQRSTQQAKKRVKLRREEAIVERLDASSDDDETS